jgi:hypothetical protein
MSSATQAARRMRPARQHDGRAWPVSIDAVQPRPAAPSQAMQGPNSGPPAQASPCHSYRHVCCEVFMPHVPAAYNSRKPAGICMIYATGRAATHAPRRNRPHIRRAALRLSSRTGEPRPSPRQQGASPGPAARRPGSRPDKFSGPCKRRRPPPRPAVARLSCLARGMGRIWFFLEVERAASRLAATP